MRVLVTGSSGFIGGRLASELEDQKHDVYCLERYVAGRTLYGGRQHKTVFADLNDHFAIKNLIRTLQPEAVFHLAASTSATYSYDHPMEVININFTAAANLAETCLREDDNLKQFLFAGSSEEYGNQTEFPIKEGAELRPNTPYAVAKVAADKYLRYMYDAYAFPATILRNFNSYGRVHDRQFIVERIITQMLKGGEVRLGDRSPVRDFEYVDDHMNAYLSCLGRREAIGEVFNFCTGVGVTIGELAETIAGIVGFRGDVVWGTIPQRPLDIQCLIGDNAKAERILGWKPTVKLRVGLTRTINALKAAA